MKDVVISKTLPKDITSYDLLKTFAVVIMIIDHFGAYFFPDELWLRAIGRLSYPIWLFLIGYARSRDLSQLLWIGGGLLVLANFVVGMALFPLNILFVILAVRLLLDPLMKLARQSVFIQWGLAVILLLLVVLFYYVLEYGTLALLTAMFGFMARRKEETDNQDALVHFMIFAALSFIAVQALTFEFDTAQFLVMAIFSALLHSILCDFKPVIYPALTARLPAAVVWLAQLCGRRTLEIYVVHLLVFKVLALYWGTYEGMGFLDFKLF